jgi:hypothetical protein
MNDPTKTVGPPLTPLPDRKTRAVLEKVLDNADAVIDGDWLFNPPPESLYPVSPSLGLDHPGNCDRIIVVSSYPRSLLAPQTSAKFSQIISYS